MTDVVTHADPTPGDGRRRARGHRAQRGLRAPGTAARHDLPVAPDPADDGSRARHRAPEPDPVSWPVTAPGPPASRHRAEEGDRDRTAVSSAPSSATGRRRRVEDDPPTVETATAALRAPVRDAGATRAVARPTEEARTVVRRPAVSAVGPRTGSHRAPEPVPAPAPEPTEEAPAPATGPRTGSHRAATTRRGVPLRATIGLVGVGAVAALFALTTPGSPLTTSAPDDPLPRAAAQADLVTPEPAAPPVRPAAPVAPPAVSVAPTTQEPQPVIGALFDLTAGSLSQLFDNSGNEGLVEDAGRPQVVDNPDAPGRQAFQFTLGPGGKRTEVLPHGRGTQPVDGDEQYVRYTARLSDGFPTNTGSWQLLLQWHHDSPTGSPPLALQVTRGQLMMVSGGDDMRSIGPVSPGDTIDLTMHIKFSQTPGEGAVTVWRDGQGTGVTDWTPRAGTMSTHSAYLKMGMYRDPNIQQTGSVLVTDLKIGRDPNGIGGLGPRAVD